MSDEENETTVQIGGILGEVAIRSGGEIFRITEESLGNGDMGLVSEIHALCKVLLYFTRL